MLKIDMINNMSKTVCFLGKSAKAQHKDKSEDPVTWAISGTAALTVTGMLIFALKKLRK